MKVYWEIGSFSILIFLKIHKKILKVGECFKYLSLIIMLGQEPSNVRKYVRFMLFGSGIQVIWVLLVCQIQVNMDLA